MKTDFWFESILYLIIAFCCILWLLFCVLTGREVAILKFVFEG